MRDKTVEKNLYTLKFVFDYLKMEEMCERANEYGIDALYFSPDHLKTQEMCIEAEKNVHEHWNLFLIILKHKRSVMLW